MNERIELIIIEKTKIEKINDLLSENIGSVYIKVDLENLSDVRKFLISKNYTTRLMVIKNDFNVLYYIYGKKRSNKGVFNEHCKNSVLKTNDYIEKLINVSSNDSDTVFTDSDDVLTKLKIMNRIGVKL